MVLGDSGKQNQETRDALGTEPTIHPINKIKLEQVITIIHPITKQQDDIGESWIVGSSTNGIVGTNTGTASGNQQVVGGSGRVQTIQKVTALDNISWELFNYSNFKDTTNSTADWGASTTGTLSLKPSGSTAQSLAVYKDSGTVITAIMTTTFDNGSTADVTFALTADGGSNFETVTDKTEHTFTNQGTDLRWRAVGTSTANITIDRVKVGFITT